MLTAGRAVCPGWRASCTSTLQPELLGLLDSDLFHDEARDYLETEGCVSVDLFRNWVDSSSEWGVLLSAHDSLGALKRVHVAHIKDCWERAWRLQEATPTGKRGGVSPTSRPKPSKQDGELTVVAACSPTWHVDDDTRGDARFWTGLISSRVSSYETRSIANLNVGDLCDLLTGCDDTRVSRAFDRFDTDGDGYITRSELRAALEFLGFKMDQDCGDKIFEHMSAHLKVGDRPMRGRDAEDDPTEVSLTPKVFQLMLKRLRLAELFTPTAGVFKWDEHETLSQCTITVADYDAENCAVHEPLAEDDGLSFFFGCRKAFPAPKKSFSAAVDQPPIRWVHLNAVKGLDRLTLLRLAVKYGVHPLAIDDVLDSKTSTKVDRYGNDYVVSLDLLGVVNSNTGSAEPPRVRIHRSHVTIMLTGPPERDTLLTIHQERGDKSSWLQMWRGGCDEESAAETGDLWKGMLADLRRGRDGTGSGCMAERRMPPKRMRQERADFLLYEVLHRVVQQIRPIAEAYAKRLGWMRQRPINQLSQACMDEVQDVKLEIYDFVRSIRPLKLVVKHFTEGDAIGPSAKMYMEDVGDAIEAMIMDIGQLTNIAETLESSHERYRDKKTNDTLFALSLLSGIFLPMQFFTGWYGMNFADMPELTWEYGYQYFWSLEILCLVVSVLGITWLRYGTDPLVSMGAAMLHCRRRTKVHSEGATEGDTRALTMNTDICI